MIRRARRNQRRLDPATDADVLTLLSRAVNVARRRLRYRIGAALVVAATLAAAVVLVR